MSTLALRSAAILCLSDLSFSDDRKPYFLLSHNVRRQWVIPENTRRRTDVFLSRQAALRFTPEARRS